MKYTKITEESREVQRLSILNDDFLPQKNMKEELNYLYQFEGPEKAHHSSENEKMFL